MAKKLPEIREGDRILVWLKVRRVSDEDDNPSVTVEMPSGNRDTARLAGFDLEKTERRPNWPE